MFSLNREKVQLWLEAWRKEMTIPGVTLAIQFGSEYPEVFTAGFSDLDEEQPLPEEACFYLYSISKTYLAIITLGLVEGKELDLDEPLLYLPEAVSIRQLLNHTTGIPDYEFLDCYQKDLRKSPGDPWDDDRFIQETINLPMEFYPGTGWNYSNTGYFHLRNIVENKTGLSFQDLMFRFITRPLNLKNTRIIRYPGSLFVSPGYSSFWSPDGRLENIRNLYHPNWVGHRTVCSNAVEVVKVFHALFTGQLISASSLKAMTTMVPVNSRPVFPVVAPQAGLGILCDNEAPHGLTYDHSGAGPGFSTLAMHLPDFHDRPFSLCLLANKSNVDVRAGVYRLMGKLQDTSIT